MKRVVCLVWAAAVLFLLWLLPSATTVSHQTVEGAAGRVDGHWPLRRVCSLIRDWLQRVHLRIYKEILCFVAKYCIPVWAKALRQGFVALGSSCPQTVLGHIVSLINTFIVEAREEGFSPGEVMEGVCGAIVHEMDEVVSGKDIARLPLPRRRADRRRFVLSWWPDSDWIPTPGNLSKEWIQSYQRSRSSVKKFLEEKAGPRLARIILRYFDKFHLSEGRVWVLLRDCHHLELVREAISEKVTAVHFTRDALANVVYARIRLEILQEYGEAVKKGEQEPLEI